MRVVVVGLGIQGHKRRRIAGTDVVGVVDPVVPGVDFRAIEDVPLDSYDAALACLPDAAKLPVLTYLLGHGKHVLVEKPLIADDDADLERLERLAREHQAVCYTAYNHRFEPHFVRLRQAIEAGALGEVYLARFLYGNGTARDVRDSVWRDVGAGVLPDLGSHLLDTARFLFGDVADGVKVWSANRFENAAFDHVTLGCNAGRPVLEMEMTLLSWRNHFTADVYGSQGSAHIESLCKWGPSTFRLRRRVLPSGRPPEEAVELIQADPTWEVEYDHFKRLCADGRPTDLATDKWINRTLRRLGEEALAGRMP